MPTFVIGKRDAPEDLAIEVWLEVQGGDLLLKGRLRGTEDPRNIFGIRADGTGYRVEYVGQSLGLKLDGTGRIRLTEG